MNSLSNDLANLTLIALALGLVLKVSVAALCGRHAANRGTRRLLPPSRRRKGRAVLPSSARPAPFELIAMGTQARWDEATERRVKEGLR